MMGQYAARDPQVVTKLGPQTKNIYLGEWLRVQDFTYPIACWPRASKTASRASELGQSVLINCMVYFEVKSDKWKILDMLSPRMK